MIPFDAKALNHKKVLVRADLNSSVAKKKHQSYQLESLYKTLKALITENCHIRLLLCRGDPFAQRGDVSDISALISQALEVEVRWCELTDLANDAMKPGAITLLPNAFLSPTDKFNDPELVRQWLLNLDAVVLDNHHFLDAQYASSQGIISAGLPVWMGPELSRVARWRQSLSGKKVGLILGGSQIAWQMEFAQALSKQISFVALGHLLTAACIADDSFDPMFDHSIVGYLRSLSTQGIKVLYPVEVLAYHESLCRTRVCLLNDVDADERIKDVCLRTVNRIYDEVEKGVDVVIFSGAMGQYQDPRFHKGTEMLLCFLATHSVETVLLGRDIIQAAVCSGRHQSFDYLIEGSSYERQLLLQQGGQACLQS